MFETICIEILMGILQGALADIFLRGSNVMQDVRGMASLVRLPFSLCYKYSKLGFISVTDL